MSAPKPDRRWISVVELGERVAAELRAENYGLNRQRQRAITVRTAWRRGWIVVREGDRPVGMIWDWVRPDRPIVDTAPL